MAHRLSVAKTIMSSNATKSLAPVALVYEAEDVATRCSIAQAKTSSRLVCMRISSTACTYMETYVSAADIASTRAAARAATEVARNAESSAGCLFSWPLEAHP